MQTRTYSKNSLHWRLASVYGPLSEWEDKVNICMYVWCVIRGACFVVFLLFLGAILGAVLADFFAWIIAACVLHQWLDPAFGATVILVILGAIAIFFLIGLTVVAKGEIGEHLREKGMNPFYSDAYRSWKERTCFKINLE